MKTTGSSAIMFLPSLNKVLLLLISYHIISYHIISYHIISYHTISYHSIFSSVGGQWILTQPVPSLEYPGYGQV